MLIRWSCLSLCACLCVGCVDPNAVKQAAEKQAAEKQQQAEADNGPLLKAADGKPAKNLGQIFSQEGWKLVDKNEVLKKSPHLVEVENTVEADDPLSAAAQAYFTLGSKAHLLAFKHNVDIFKAMNERAPTFAEFDQMIRQGQVELKGLYPWQVYAYDEKTGEICILEDRIFENELRKQAGLPPRED